MKEVGLSQVWRRLLCELDPPNVATEKKMQEDTLESQKIKKTQVIQNKTNDVYSTLYCLLLLRCVFFGCKPGLVPSMPEFHWEEEKWIWNSILFLPNFQGLIPLKMWLRRALMWLNLYDCQAVLKKGNFRAKKWYNFTKNISISQTLKE